MLTRLVFLLLFGSHGVKIDILKRYFYLREKGRKKNRNEWVNIGRKKVKINK
jgi:hypothetical protein